MKDDNVMRRNCDQGKYVIQEKAVKLRRGRNSRRGNTNVTRRNVVSGKGMLSRGMPASSITRPRGKKVTVMVTQLRQKVEIDRNEKCSEDIY